MVMVAGGGVDGGFGARDLTEEELAGKRRQHFTQQFFWRGWKKDTVLPAIIFATCFIATLSPL